MVKAYTGFRTFCTSVPNAHTQTHKQTLHLEILFMVHHTRHSVTSRDTFLLYRASHQATDPALNPSLQPPLTLPPPLNPQPIPGNEGEVGEGDRGESDRGVRVREVNSPSLFTCYKGPDSLLVL